MTASEILIKSGVTSLPVDMRKIAAAFNIRIADYESCAEAYEMDVQRMYREISMLGFSFRTEEGYVAAINRNSCGRLRRHWTTAHEVAHILLGHVTEKVARLDVSCEREADRLAGEMLAPLAVLHFCGVSSAEETGRLCGLSKQAAEIRFRQLAELRRSSSALARVGQTAFAQTPDQRQLLRQFLPFISEYITRRSAHDGYAEYLKQIGGHSMIIE